MRKYAEGTEVPVEKSQGEIMALLAKYGLTSRGMFHDEDTTTIGFKRENISYRMSVCTENDTAQEERRKWRSFCLVIKAKLVAITDGIATFEEEFLAHAVTSTGETVGEAVIPRLKAGATLALGNGKEVTK